MQDGVPQTRIYKVWSVPEWGNIDADHLSLAASILGRVWGCGWRREEGAGNRGATLAS
jgi:hypothetical protein